MRKALFIFTLFLFCLNIKAQKYGVSIGYVYSYGKAEYRPDLASLDQQLFGPTNFKYNLFPNAFIRPYVRLYKRISVFAGAEITKYTINFHQNLSYWDVRIKQCDLHFPIGLKFNFLDERKKTGHAIYIGTTLIYHLDAEKKFIANDTSSQIMPPRDYSLEPNLFVFKNQRINFIAGYEFNYKLKDWFSLSSNIYIKYMPTFVDYSRPVTTDSSPAIRNKFSFSISLGCSFMKPPKQKEEEASKVFRLED